MVSRDKKATIAFIIFLILSIAPSKALQVVPFIPKDKSASLLYQSTDDQIKYVSQNQNSLSLIEASKSTSLYKSSFELAYFQVISTPSKKNVVVEIDESPFNNLHVQKNKTLLWGSFKGNALNPLGQGSQARLHLNDDWVSSFDASTNTIHFYYLQLLGKSSYKVTLNNKFSPYFIPEVSFIDHDQVIYTDINEKGEEALITYNLKTNNFMFLHKVVGAGKKITHCLLGNDLVFAELDLSISPSFSLFVMTYSGDRNFSEKKNIFNDSNKYQPRILCSPNDKTIFALKRQSRSLKYSEAYNLLMNISIPKGNNLETLLDRPFSQIFTMDTRVLLQSGGKVYQVIK